MGLFTSGFEKAMYRELFDSPFSGYSSASRAPLSDLIFDYCASVAHNKKLFPNGVEKKKRERTLYSSYAMGAQLVSLFAPDKEAEKAAKAAFSGFSKTAIQSGASQSLVSERLALIMRCIEAADMVIDQNAKDDATAEAALEIAYLRMFDIEINEQTADGMIEEIEKFHEVIQQFMCAHNIL